MKNKFISLLATLFMVFSFASCKTSDEKIKPITDNSKSNPCTVEQMINEMKNYSVGQESTNLYYVTGKAVNVSFDKQWSSYTCYFEGHDINSEKPFQLYGGMLSLTDLDNPQNIRTEDIEGTEISFYGRAYCYVNNGKLVYQIGYVRGGSQIDPIIYNINKQIPNNTDDNWKTPGSGKVDIKQTLNDFSGNNTRDAVYTPSLGQPKLLIIPLWFTDTNDFILDSKEESVHSDIEKAFFGTNEDTGWRSVKTYYEEESGGLLQLQGTVSEFLSVPATTGSFGTADRICRNVENFVSSYFSFYQNQSRQDFDTNGDGYLDGVVIISGSRNPTSETRAHCDSLGTEPNFESPVTNEFMWCTVFDMFGSNYYNHTGVTANSDGGGYTAHCELDTTIYIHEMAHMLGIWDYYDYSGTYSPAGDLTMQDVTTMGSHDPFSVMAYGWADPYIPTESCTIEIGAFQSTKELILLTPHWNKQDSPFDEYLLLELYTPTGLNKFNSEYDKYGDYLPTASGIRLWHVDARLAAYINHQYCEKLTTDALCQYKYWYAMMNTYYAAGLDGYLSPLGSKYYDYNLLQFIRNDTSATYKPKGGEDGCISNNTLFKDGDSFDMSTYGRQFKRTGKLNSGLTLGWSFSVSITGEGVNTKATVTLTKQ